MWKYKKKCSEIVINSWKAFNGDLLATTDLPDNCVIMLAIVHSFDSSFPAQLYIKKNHLVHISEMLLIIANIVGFCTDAAKCTVLIKNQSICIKIDVIVVFCRYIYGKYFVDENFK